MSKYFGTDGFRGRAGEVLTAEHAFKTGRFLGWYYKNKEGRTARIRGAHILRRFLVSERRDMRRGAYRV